MHKQLFLTIGVLLSISSLYAQHSLYLGVKGGYHASTANLTHTIFVTTIPTSQIFGASGGILVKYFPKPHYGIQAELNYSQKGFDQVLFDTNEVFRTKFNYLELPILFSIYLGKRKTQYFANFGPYLALLMDHTVTGSQNSTSEQLDYLYQPGRDNESSFGVKIAGGIFREFSFGGLQVDGFFSADISNFLDPVDLSNGVPDSSQNLVFGVSVAYLIPIGSILESPE